MSHRVKPILYIAFADPENVPGAALPSLKVEEAKIREALAGVCDPGPWEMVSGLHCTRHELVRTFDSDRVAVFHFGGHASPQSLLLPAEEKGSQIVNGMLLEDFLARQKHLKLAFFNACSTERWARQLSEHIPYVVATVCAVDDAKALDFASAFYAALAADNTIEEAFSRACGAVVLQHEDLKPSAALVETDAVLGRPEFRRMDTDDYENDQPAFPWVLCRNGRATAEDSKWTFSVGAHDPMIGLPLLDPEEYPLPERPYVTIKGHSESDAPLFFGRNAEIRALYDWVLERRDGPPVLLFHGQSGSGKSSLLNAGLLPRLRKKRNVVYRKRGVDLLQDLRAAIGGTDAEIDQWLGAPEPHLVILDQVEEAITQNAGAADEMRAFVERVKQIFARRGPASKARLVLSFRKEYLAEIQGLFARDESDNAPPLVESFWLDRLDSEGIVEVVEGPTRNPDLKQKYGITLEDGFAEFVASRLNDPNSPITTILQIVLNQLWDKVKDEGGAPVYTRELWGKLSALDNPLHGFYEDQLERVFADGGATYRDGLELDLLLEHTSELGTSQRRTLAELSRMYPQLEPAALDQLIRRNKAAYLLVDPPVQEGDGAAATVLVHDTLAPVVRRDFALSVSEGARARRLVENRGRDWTGGRQGEPLDRADLRVVRRGLKHMRALTSDETRLIAASRKAAMRTRAIAASFLVLLPVLLIVLLATHVSSMRATMTSDVANAAASLDHGDRLFALVQAMDAERLRETNEMRITGRLISGAALDKQISDDLVKALMVREVYRRKINEHAHELGACGVAIDAARRPIFSIKDGHDRLGQYDLPDELASEPETWCDPASQTIAFFRYKPGTNKDVQPAVFVWSKGTIRTYPIPAPLNNASPRAIRLSPGGAEALFQSDESLSKPRAVLLDLAKGTFRSLDGLYIAGDSPITPSGRYATYTGDNSLDVVDLLSPKPARVTFDPLYPLATATGSAAAQDIAAIVTTNNGSATTPGSPGQIAVYRLSDRKRLTIPLERDPVAEPSIGLALAQNQNGALLAYAVAGHIAIHQVPADWRQMPQVGNAAMNHVMNYLFSNMPGYAGTYRGEFDAFKVSSDFYDSQYAFSPDLGYLATADYHCANCVAGEDNGNPPLTGMLRVWSVEASSSLLQAHKLAELSKKPPRDLYAAGCRVIGSWIEDLAVDRGIVENAPALDYGAILKLCKRDHALQ